MDGIPNGAEYKPLTSATDESIFVITTLLCNTKVKKKQTNKNTNNN